MDKYFVARGAHPAEEARCAMEWVAYIAGEEHTDHPVCVDPALRNFIIMVNDAMPDDDRQKLRPYLARMIGTAHDGLSLMRRAVIEQATTRVVPSVLDCNCPSCTSFRMSGEEGWGWLFTLLEKLLPLERIELPVQYVERALEVAGISPELEVAA